MKSFTRWLLDLIYPPKCMWCHRLLPSSDTITCGRCEDRLSEYEGAARKVTFFEHAAVSFYYEGNVREAVMRYKFYGMQFYSTEFAKHLSARVRAELSGTYDMISWVPCSRMRRWTRGFDQSQLLAQAMAEELGVPCVCTLKKIRNTPKQSKQRSEAARRANVLGAYKAVEPERFSGKRILLIDDVLTTGSTMSECGKTLRMAGSGNPVCAAIAAARHKTK